MSESDPISPFSTLFTTTSRIRRRLRSIVEDLIDVRDQGQIAQADSSQVPLFRGMLRSLDTTYSKFCQEWDDLQDLNDEQGASALITAEDEEMRKRARRYYHDANSSAEIIFASKTLSSTSYSVSPHCNESSGKTRHSHPVIPIPTFNGNRVKWREFRDVFKSLVHEDSSLSDAERFHYLKGALLGPASTVLSKLPPSGDNYHIAWTALQRAYDKPRLLATAYVDQILDLKPLSSKTSIEALRLLVSQFSNSVAALKELSIPDQSDFVFFHLARRLLPQEVREAFEPSTKGVDFPSLDVLLDYVREYCDFREMASGVSYGDQSTGSKPPIIPKKVSSARFGVDSIAAYSATSHNPLEEASVQEPTNEGEPVVNTDNGRICWLCQESSHALYSCPTFKVLPVEDRQARLKGWTGCRNCLTMGHSTRSCSSRWRCKHCRSKHHTLLHQPIDHSSITSAIGSPSLLDNSPSCSLPSKISLAQSLLGTARAYVNADKLDPVPIRMVLDSGSNVSFITRELAERCKMKIKPISVEVRGIGDTPMLGYKGISSCRLWVHPQQSWFVDIEALVVDKIMPPQPRFRIPDEVCQAYKDFSLADDRFAVPSPVDFLLGCDLFATIITGEVLTIRPDYPRLLGTVFGYVVLGRIGDLLEAIPNTLLASTCDKDNELNLQLQRFWAIDNPPPASIMSKEDKQCEAYFEKTHFRLPSGRYVVRLPFRDTPPAFVGNHNAALRRLTHLEGKLQSNKSYGTLYREFMEEYIRLGHMELARSSAAYLIPHHGVLKGLSEPPKLRVVFDASAKCKNGSLNDYLLVGPKLQNDLPTVLLNFRIHKVAFTVDIVKMYRQILIHSEDRAFQHILWRPYPAHETKEFELCTVTYGLSCAPYLALRVIRQLVHDEGDKFPLAARVLKEDMYVDDIVTGGSTLTEALQLQKEIIGLLQKGEFPLSKWVSNEQAILSAIKDSFILQQGPRSMDLELEKFVKILGLQWDPQQDVFSYNIAIPNPVFTKRGALSVVAQIYDPLGFLGPVVVVAKSMLQQAWQLGLEWDQPFPEHIRQEWQALLNELPILKELKIPRAVCQVGNIRMQLLLFADASEVAYCATAFLRTESDTVSCCLLLARTKLAPIKKQTIPRLELCAAVLAIKVLSALESFKGKLSHPMEVLLFTDSSVVLSWIKNPMSKKPCFEANRIAQILESSSPDWWHHVRSQDNPSDLGSRGVRPHKFISSNLWFEGPPWIKADPRTWPIDTVTHLTDIQIHPEPTVMTTEVTVVEEEDFWAEWIHKFSSLSFLVRSFAYVLRFINNARKPTNARETGCLTLPELKKALQICCSLEQNRCFPQGNCKSSTIIPTSLLPLSPFYDEAGLLRVGGRLRHSNLPSDHKHPILLPAKSHLSILIVEYYHKIFLHAGSGLVTAVVRTQFWIVGLRSLARKVSLKCVWCRKENAKYCQPKMGDLPVDRFIEERAFLHVGLDFAGPFMIKQSSTRRSSFTKAYLCLAVCFSTKALHLEVVSSLSTSALLNALNRFIARRGLPVEIFSDNGTNFVGAANHLKELNKWLREPDTQSGLSDYAISRGFEWKFIPPHAPHFGGLWEAGVKSVKRLLKRSYGEQKMTFEEISTLMSKIEAILNSRPLCPLSSDPNDFSYLSPAHFLIGGPLLIPPEPSLLDRNINYLTRWQVVTQVAQHFWQRWRTEYLANLQSKGKWRRNEPNLQVGDLVLLKDSRVDRMQWPRGRIQEVHPGPDGVVRVATVRVSRGNFRRPVTQLIPLLLQTNYSEK